MEYKVISADGHIVEPPHLWEKWLPKEFQKFAPKLVNLLLLVSNHTTMHAGQFTVVRRKLGKPVLF